MNLKLRFALLFTGFVAIILFLSCITIYVLFSSSRQEDYYQHVSKEGIEVHNVFMDVRKENPEVAYKLAKEVHDKSLYNERLLIVDSTGRDIFRFPDSISSASLFISLEELEKRKAYRYEDSDSYQGVAIFMPKTRSYIYVSGFDLQGFQKLRNLKIILITVFFGALLISSVISFVFVKEAVRPLKELGLQMQKTTVQNLVERVKETSAKDEINEIARNFNGMLERLSKAFEFQKSFVYHASHELRTPLATMLSETEAALNKEPDAENFRKVLLSLKEEQQEMIELTNSLLLISQFEHISYGEDWRLLRIDEVLYETVSISKKLFPDMMVNIDFAQLPERDDDFTIMGNESLLKSAFSNLVKNAYSYSVDQKVSIIIDSEGESILVHVDNKGMQLLSEEKESMMVPFFRGGNALRTKGYGLGLSIVYRIISIHKGTVTYTPVSNDSNRFTVMLYKASAAVYA